MTLTRRAWLALSATAVAAAPLASSRPAWAAKQTGIRAIVFDGFTIFEPHLSTDRVRAFKPDPRAYHGIGATLRDLANFVKSPPGQGPEMLRRAELT